jgi:hypothetical protein
MVLPYIIFTNNEWILHRKAFRADYISRSTKICAPSSARITAVKIFFKIFFIFFKIICCSKWYVDE